MARDHARVKVSIWGDPDFRALTAADQWGYLAAFSQAGLSYCGVLDYIPGRIAQLADDLTATKVKAIIRGLERAKFIVVDRETAELLVRSYVRHDGVLERVNMGKAVGSAFERVTSAAIRDAIAVEMGRLMAEEPSLAGWIGLKETSPMAYAMASSMASSVASTMPSTFESGEA